MHSVPATSDLIERKLDKIPVVPFVGQILADRRAPLDGQQETLGHVSLGSRGRGICPTRDRLSLYYLMRSFL